MPEPRRLPERSAKLAIRETARSSDGLVAASGGAIVGAILSLVLFGEANWKAAVVTVGTALLGGAWRAVVKWRDQPLERAKRAEKALRDKQISDRKAVAAELRTKEAETRAADIELAEARRKAREARIAVDLRLPGADPANVILKHVAEGLREAATSKGWTPERIKDEQDRIAAAKMFQSPERQWATARREKEQREAKEQRKRIADLQAEQEESLRELQAAHEAAGWPWLTNDPRPLETFASHQSQRIKEMHAKSVEDSALYRLAWEARAARAPDAPDEVRMGELLRRAVAFDVFRQLEAWIGRFATMHDFNRDTHKFDATLRDATAFVRAAFDARTFDGFARALDDNRRHAQPIADTSTVIGKAAVYGRYMANIRDHFTADDVRLRYVPTIEPAFEA
jgi:hypothetical protein